jgi:HEAT repeat protein
MQHRLSSFVLPTAVAAAGIALIVWYRAFSPDAVTVVPAAAPAIERRETPASSASPHTVVSVPSKPTEQAVAQWIADTQSSDAAKRATAIAALADAPKAQVLPALRRLLIDAEPLVDRPLALRSLRDLALNQGDADGAVREAVRNAIYHGDDQAKTDDVQEVLDIIEESEQH